LHGCFLITKPRPIAAIHVNEVWLAPDTGPGYRPLSMGLLITKPGPIAAIHVNEVWMAPNAPLMLIINSEPER